MTPFDKAIHQLKDASAMSYEARRIIVDKIAELEARNAVYGHQLKRAAVVTGQLTEEITKLINNQSVLATIGSNALRACGRGDGN